MATNCETAAKASQIRHNRLQQTESVRAQSEVDKTAPLATIAARFSNKSAGFVRTKDT
ncbi:MAG: hypothetical protein ACI8V5_004148, partial [Limisphaerales bacterium]